MALSQDIRPFHQALCDTVTRASEPWIEQGPLSAMKLLWTGAETGGWAVLLRWKKGYVAPPHKHLSASHTYILSGRLKVRDGTYEAGDYVYEPNGVLHDATEALEDTVYLFICNGPLIFFDDNGLTRYRSWEELEREREQRKATPAVAAE
jgi:anti-sigma factor ChrR (cupin superfamily)